MSFIELRNIVKQIYWYVTTLIIKAFLLYFPFFFGSGTVSCSRQLLKWFIIIGDNNSPNSLISFVSISFDWVVFLGFRFLNSFLSHVGFCWWNDLNPILNLYPFIHHCTTSCIIPIFFHFNAVPEFCLGSEIWYIQKRRWGKLVSTSQ